MHKYNCLTCNKYFESKKNYRKYCSLSCAAILNNPKFHSGENHPKYKKIKIKHVRDPLKHRVRNKVYKAVKSGKLIKTSCIVCNNCKVEAHHSDYSKPLQIEWLCRLHHKQADKRDGTKLGDFELTKLIM